MTTHQQRKAKARARYEAYVERQHHKSDRRRRRNVVLASVAGVAIVVVGGWFIWQATSDDASESASDAQQQADDFTYDAAAPVLPKGAPADLILDTDHGPITIALDTTKAPNNSNSLAFLASQGYYDNTTCHRLTTDGLYVLQCGLRSGTGAAGPGYTTADENVPKDGKDNYPRGTVAMAEPDNGDAGSEFFLVYKDTTLPAKYTIVGQMTEGLDVVDQIAKAGVAEGSGSPTDGAPAEPITITAASIKQSP